MKTIEISYSRTAYYHKIIEVENDVAEEALKCDGEDLNANSSRRMAVGFNLITEDLTDIGDIHAMGDEIEDVSITIYKTK